MFLNRKLIQTTIQRRSYSSEKAFSYKSLPKESQILIDKILRVDHAGEFGADRIYAGQMAVLGKSSPYCLFGTWLDLH